MLLANKTTVAPEKVGIVTRDADKSGPPEKIPLDFLRDDDNVLTANVTNLGATSFLEPFPVLALVGQIFSALPTPILEQVVLAYDDFLTTSPELIFDATSILLRLPNLDFQNPLTLDAYPANGAFTQIVAFGDSLTDTGNLSRQLATNFGIDFPPFPYGLGRLSDGPLWIEYLANDFSTMGFPLPPESIVNNATIGATAGRGNVAAGTVTAITGAALPQPLNDFLNQLPGVQAQVDLFADNVGVLDPNALYVVWGGANDFLTLPIEPIAAVNAVVDTVESIADSIITLVEGGAEKIVVPNLPNLGRVPLAIAEDLVPQATAFSVGFNLLLQGTLGALEPELGVDLIQVDVFSLIESIAQRPSEFGFTNITDPLIDVLAAGGNPNPSEFTFVDGFHPTTNVHRLIADAIGRAVMQPTPGMVLPTTLNLVGGLLGGVESGLLSQLTSFLLPLLGELPNLLGFPPLPYPVIEPPPVHPVVPCYAPSVPDEPLPPGLIVQLPFPPGFIPEPGFISKPPSPILTPIPTEPIGPFPLMPIGPIPLPLFSPIVDPFPPTSQKDLFGTHASEILKGGAGNDNIYGNGGMDTLIGCAGDDHIYGSSASEKIMGGLGHDVIYANGGMDYIDSGHGMDEVWLGGKSNATVRLTVGEGHDTIVNYQAGSTRLQVASLEGLSTVNSGSGLEIWQGGDRLAVVAHHTQSSFSNASFAIA